MEDVTCYGCQHITGKDPEGFLTFCEAPVKPNSSYCSEHHGQKWKTLGEYVPEQHELDRSRDSLATRWVKNPW